MHSYPALYHELLDVELNSPNTKLRPVYIFYFPYILYLPLDSSVPFSSGDGGEDSFENADSGNSGASDSDAPAAGSSSRGRASTDRRVSSGGVVKREKREPVPVSPPRQSVIAAAHEAEEGSQIKVKFDTGHWYGGTILEVDSQR